MRLPHSWSATFLLHMQKAGFLMTWLICMVNQYTNHISKLTIAIYYNTSSLIKQLIIAPNTMKPLVSTIESRFVPGFWPGPTQTGLYNHRRWLEAWNFWFTKQRNCTFRVAKTKALISLAVTAKLICVFVFAYAKSRFSHDEAQLESIQSQMS